MVAHAFNPSTWEAEAGRFLSSGQPGLQSEFQDSSRGYTEKPCLKNKQTNKTNQNKQQQQNQAKQKTKKQQRKRNEVETNLSYRMKPCL